MSCVQPGDAAGTPRISVVIAAYNVAPCLARAVESVRAQDCQDFEILIVDDGSSDATLTVAHGLALIDSRIRVFSLPCNKGPSVARNRGLAEARGDWIAILDADDAYLPGRLGHLLELAVRREADVVADNLVLYDLGADELLPPAFDWTQEHQLLLDRLLAGDRPGQGYPLGWIQPLWRRDFLHRHGLEYPQQYRYTEDFFLLASACLTGARIWLSPRAEYVYTMRCGPLSRQVSAVSATQVNVQDLINSTEELIRRYRAALLPRQVRSLRTRWRESLTTKVMADAIETRRRRGLLAALLFLRPYPRAACRLALQRAVTVVGAVKRRVAG